MSAGRIGARLGLALASLVVCVGLAEVVARASYDAPWHQRLVSAQAAGQELDYERNVYNLRGPAYAYARPATTRRILAIGDSFTFGMGVPEDEDIFLRRCERALNERLGAGLDLPGVERVEVLNGSIIGSLTSHWRDVWIRLSVRFTPDVLLFVFFLRDGTLAGSIPEFFDVIRDELAARNAGSPWYRRCYLYRHWKDARDAAAIRAHYTRAFREAYFGDAEATAEWRRARENLTAMTADARAHGCAVGFVVFPVLAGLREEPYVFQDVVDLLLDFAREQGMATLDLLPAFRGHDGPELWVSPVDQHPNVAAHALAAEALEPFLEQLLRAREALPR